MIIIIRQGDAWERTNFMCVYHLKFNEAALVYADNEDV